MLLLFYSVCLFVGVYWFVQEDWLHPLTLFTLSTTLTVLGYAFTTPLTKLSSLSCEFL